MTYDDIQFKMTLPYWYQWLESNLVYPWLNGFNFRFSHYVDRIDHHAFFEEINAGWYEMYIYPYDDWYSPTISFERKLRLAQ